MNQYVYDEINNITKSITKGKLIPGAKLDVEYTIICDEHEGMTQYLLGVLSLLQNKNSKIKINLVNETMCISSKKIAKIQKQYGAEINFYKNKEKFLKTTHTSTSMIFLYMVNIHRVEYDSIEFQKKKEENLLIWLLCAQTYKSKQFILLSFIPSLDVFPDGISAISEREYEVVVDNKSKDSKEQYLLKLEELCRNSIKSGLNIKILRYDNVFGPGFDVYGNTRINEIINEFIQNNKLITNCDENLVEYSGCYIRYAIIEIFLILKKGKIGNIYNTPVYKFTMFDLVSKILKSFIEKKPTFMVNSIISENTKKQYTCLNNSKIKSLKLTVGCTLEDALYRTILDKTNEEYINGLYNTVYNGKLGRIKELELEVMAEIDTICKENDIKYFLVGGSLLGAVRHKGFIPWDDDLDIGMLREDYEKFRKICPSVLNPKFAYQSYKEERISHYIFDKIRLKDTYFTTKFSEKFKIQNGIFIDILVYDKTANSKSGQKLHVKAISVWKRVINIRWVNTARRNIHYRKTKILLPIMRLIPFRWYHNVFEKIIQHYNKTESPYLIDGVGMNLQKGAFPAEWFDEIVDMEFENTKFPIPAKYDEYLRHWYGDSYMELLPISSRKSGHNIIKLDLGKYLLKDSENKNFHELDPRGELFECKSSELNTMS
jgi:lipopolysaccharide cholinephosphotransferase